MVLLVRGPQSDLPPPTSRYAHQQLFVSSLYDSNILECNSVQNMTASLSKRKRFTKKESAVEKHLLSDL